MSACSKSSKEQTGPFDPKALKKHAQKSEPKRADSLLIFGNLALILVSRQP